MAVSVAVSTSALLRRLLAADDGFGVSHTAHSSLDALHQQLVGVRKAEMLGIVLAGAVRVVFAARSGNGDLIGY